MPKWYIKVNGYLVELNTGAPIRRIAIFATSGVREGDSPHRSRGVGPTAITETNGRFSTWYVTEGTEGTPSMPDGMVLFLQRPDGDWGRLPVGVAEHSVVAVEDNVITIALGPVAIDPSAFPAPAETVSNAAESITQSFVPSWKRCAADLGSKTDLLVVPSFPAAAAIIAHCPTAMILPFVDDLSHGPLVNDVTSESWVASRAKHWQELMVQNDPDEMLSLFQECTGMLFPAIAQCSRLTVCISNNLQDFLLLAFIVSAFDVHEENKRDLLVVFVDYDTQSGRRIGSLNELWPSQLESWIKKAQAISAVDRSLLQLAWSAITSADPGYLSSIAASIDEGTYECRRKLATYLQRYPSLVNGLSAVDEALLAACSAEGTKAARIVGEVLGSMVDKDDRIGDLVLFARLLKLGAPALKKPLLNLTGDLRHLRSTVASLTDFGAAVLAGHENAIAVNSIDEHIGGARLCSNDLWYRDANASLIRQ